MNPDKRLGGVEGNGRQTGAKPGCDENSALCPIGLEGVNALFCDDAPGDIVEIGQFFDGAIDGAERGR